MDFYLPQQLAKAVNATIAEKCNSLDKSNCVSSVIDVIKPGFQDLERRQLGAFYLIIAGLLAVLSIAIPTGRFSATEGGDHSHVPGSDLDQVSAAQASSTVVYELPDNPPIKVTVTNTDLPTPFLM